MARYFSVNAEQLVALATEIFGNEETDEVRGCLNMRKNKANEALRLLEKVLMAGISGWIAFVRAVEVLSGRRIEAVWKEDYPDGFHNLAMTRRPARYTVTRVLEADGRVALYIPRTVPYGPRAGPTVFCRKSHSIMFLKRKIFNILGIIHMDDEAGGERKKVAPIAHSVSVKFQASLGWAFKLEKAIPREANQTFTSAPILGLVSDFAITQADLRAGVLFRLKLPGDKKRKYNEQLAHFEDRKMIKPGAAKKATGQLEYTSTYTWNGEGRFLMAPLRRAAERETPTVVDNTMQFCLRALRAHLQEASEKVVHRWALARRHGVSFGDARGDKKGRPKWRCG